LLLGSSLSTTRMPTNASEPVREHGDGVRRGRRVRSHLRAADVAPHVVVVCSMLSKRLVQRSPRALWQPAPHVSQQALQARQVVVNAEKRAAGRLASTTRRPTECYRRLPHPRLSFVVSYFRHISSLDSSMYSSTCLPPRR
jgi:ribosomal protein L37AE/L43A